MMIKKIRHPRKIIYCSIGLIFFAYVFARTILVDITFDEAWTLGAFVRGSFYNIINCEPTVANNHLLNSFLIKLLFSFGNESVFIARLPNLISMVLYLYFSYKICDSFFKPIFGLSLFILLISNPFLLDFFGLARGYGLALGLLMSSIYFLLKFWETTVEKNGTIALLLGSFTVLSNFTFLFFWIGLYLVVHFVFFIQKDFFGKKNKLVAARFIAKTSLTALSLMGIIYFPITKLRANEAFWYGGTDGFYQDTLFSLASYSMGNEISQGGVILILNIFLSVFFISLVFFLFKNINQKTVFQKPVFILLTLLVVPIGLTIFLHHFLETKFLINRTGLFLIPLFLIAFAFLIQEIKWKHTIFFMQGSLFIFSFLSLFNFGKNSNLYSTINWPFDSRTTEILHFINEKGKEQNKVFILDSTVMFSSTLTYYEWKRKFKYVVYAKDEPDNLDESLADYFLVYEKPLTDVNYDPSKEQVNLYTRDRVLHFEKEGISLLSNLKK